MPQENPSLQVPAVIDGQQVCEQRVGLHFDNPDLSSNHYYKWRGVKNWGLIVTPDEIRYAYMFGNPLVSSKGDEWTDATIQTYIDRAIGMCERDLGITIVATQYRHRQVLQGVDRTDLSIDPATGKPEPYVPDDLYDFNRHKFEQYVDLKLHHRPLVKVQKWQMFDISTGRAIMDLLSWAKPSHKTAYLRAYPRGDTAFQLPGGGGSSQVVSSNVVGGFIGGAPGLFPAAYSRYPSGYGVDYIAGFESPLAVPFDLVEVIGMLATRNVMADFGDGITSGLANASVSLSGISESFGTTMSATSAWFGARIKDYSDRLNDWFKVNRNRWRGPRFRAFG